MDVHYLVRSQTESAEIFYEKNSADSDIAYDLVEEKIMKTICLAITALAITSVAYSENPGDHHEHSAHHAGTGELKMTLDHGRKWKMDDHTRAMFKTMTERVEAGGKAKAIGNALKADFYQLVQGCTMTGKAHDQLHLFLGAFSPAVQDLANKGSAESLKKVTKLLHEYSQYFE